MLKNSTRLIAPLIIYACLQQMAMMSLALRDDATFYCNDVMMRVVSSLDCCPGYHKNMQIHL